MLARLLRRFRVKLAIRQVEGEVAASLKKGFLGGPGVGQSLLETSVAVTDSDVFKLGLLAPGVSVRLRKKTYACISSA